MTRPVQIALCVFLLTLSACAVFVSWRIGRALQSFDDAAAKVATTVDATPSLQPTVDRVNAAIEAISGPRGTLHEVNKAVVKIGDAVVTTQMQERAIAPATIAAVNSLATIAPHVLPVLDAGTETLHGASATLRTMNDKAGPLFDAYTRSGDDLDTLLKSHAIYDTLDNVSNLTQNLAGVSADAQKVSDKATADYLKKQTAWGKVTTRLWGGYDILAWAAQHRP